MTHEPQTTQEPHTTPEKTRLIPLDVAVFSRGQQTKRSVQHFRTPSGKRVRLTIVCDSVDFQSRADASVLDQDLPMWNSVADLHYSHMQTVQQRVNPYAVFSHEDHIAFERDQAALLDQLAFLLD